MNIEFIEFMKKKLPQYGKTKKFICPCCPDLYTLCQKHWLQWTIFFKSPYTIGHCNVLAVTRYICLRAKEISSIVLLHECFPFNLLFLGCKRSQEDVMSWCVICLYFLAKQCALTICVTAKKNHIVGQWDMLYCCMKSNLCLL